MTGLSEQEKLRYKRNLILDEIGEEGQRKLKQGRILVVGAGGLGSPVLFYLAAAGVGTLGLADNDVVDVSNLQRQILHSTPDIGQRKTDSACQKLTRLNPAAKIIAFSGRVTGENVDDLIAAYDVVVDATDNFPTRFLLNEACVKNGVPFIHGGIIGFTGQVMTIKPGAGPCFRCLFHEPPAEAVKSPPGVLGSVAGTIGTMQASEAIKILLARGRLLTGRLLIYDALDASFREISVKNNPECPVCG